MGGVVKKAKKLVRKAIPKEIKPALPYIAAFAGQPYLAKGLGAVGTFAANNPAVTKALIASGTAAATQDDPNLLRTAALAAAPDVVSGGLEKLGTAGNIVYGPQEAGSLSGILKSGQQLALKGADVLQPTTFTGAAKLIGGQSAVDAASQLAEIQQDQIDAYNRQLQEQGVMNKVKRRQGIFDIYMNAGYDADYVNSVLDKYGYADGGIVELMEKIRAKMKAPESVAKAMSRKNRFRTQKDKKNKKTFVSEPNEKGEITINVEGSEGDDGFLQSLQTAREGIEMSYKPPVGSVQAQPMMKFARGGEVEIEEEAGDLGIMDLMKDQGIEYGEQVSAPNTFAELNMLAIDLFGRPYDQLTDGEQETLMDFVGSKSQAGGEGIMQMASGYKSDIEEMYEQYVFEMEEMGLQPMSFSEFLARERAGMVDGGDVPEYDVEGETMEGRMMEDFIREGMDKGKQENKKRFFEDYEQYRRRRNTKEKGIEVANGGIISMADGGIMEKDMRGGGFIPEGSKERADDVPARLSKNEFVMTADAVRAAGGGSVNKGAKRMYDLMYSLEGKI